jgi:LCP family protein required for cell wall assembly
MALRIDEPAPGPSSWVPRRRARHLSAGTRMLFTFGLLVFGITSLYTSAALLARVTPALFPGETLSSVIPGPIPAASILSEPGADSVFNRRINILVMGLDSRPGQEDDFTLPPEERLKARTDTLMVASVDPVTESITFLSFPRDLVISVHPAKGQPYDTRINESFYEGVLSGGDLEAGAEQVQRDLKANFGVETDYWVILDFRGVADVIDAIGGIDVTVPEELAIDEWWYSDDDKTHQLISIPAGHHNLDGYMAVAFSRNRDPSDLTRIKRQQLVMDAAVTEVFAQGLLSPSRWPDLWSSYKSTIETNIPNGRLPGYANLVRDTRGNIQNYSLGDPVGDSPTVWDGWLYGGAVLYWDPENVRYWISRAFPPAEYANAVVEIQTALGPGRDDEALAVGRHIEFDMAIPTVYLGPPAEPSLSSEVLVYGDDRRSLAEDIARALQLPKSVIRELPRDDESLPDILVVLGEDAQLREPEVSAAGG